MENLVFQKLTPTDDVDLSGYNEGFDFIFENSDIRNVAISGAYSSGKSSVLETYEKSHPEKEFLHISLAHFVEQENFLNLHVLDKQEDEKSKNNKPECDPSEDNGNSTERSYERIIEGKILNQLIQQISVDKIPQTNFHIKRNVSKWKIALGALWVGLFVLSILYFHYITEWNIWVSSIGNSVMRAVFTTTLAKPFQALLSVADFGLVLFCIYKILLFQKTKNIFRKLNIQGNEIEIFSDTQDSYFDKYLNEILYLFGEVDADAIVFEDIDRFDNIEIFERLREINTLANIRRRGSKGFLKKIIKRKDRTIRFFFLMRDDVFTTKDRTKFFDYIIPVIPVVDSSNAYNKLREYLTYAGVYEQFNDHFLRGLSLYIDDLRLLKNIVNEFQIYNRRLNKIELDANKMLAMITYKNIFPKDCADLQLRKGFVFTLFSKKTGFIQTEHDRLLGEMSDLNERISRIDTEIAETTKELDWIRDRKKPNNQYSQDSKEYANWLKTEYPKKKQSISDRAAGNKEILQAKYDSIAVELTRIENKPLSQIITRENIDEIFMTNTITKMGRVIRYSEIKESRYFELLKFLVRNGYIDESYNDYMTYFYPNSLSPNDKIYLRSVSDKKKKAFDYPIDNKSLVLENLSATDFLQEETLNFDLIDFLLINGRRDYLEMFVQQVKNNQCFDFIQEYYIINRTRQEFVNTLNELWPEFFSELLGRESMSNIVRSYSLDSLQIPDPDILIRMNLRNCLSDYISEQADYLAISDREASSILIGLQTIEVKFLKITAAGSRRALIDGVYERSLYQINPDNVRMFFIDRYEHKNGVPEFAQCLTSIFAEPQQPLTAYLGANMGLAVDAVLNMTDCTFGDSQETVLRILNDESIPKDIRMKYLERNNTCIDNLEDVTENKFKQILMCTGLLGFTADNILLYNEHFGLTDELVSFMDRVETEIDYTTSPIVAQVKGKLFDDATKNSSLSDYRYREIVRQLGKNTVKLQQTGLPASHVSILAQEKKITMSQENLKTVRANYREARRDYISSDFAKYLGLIANAYDHDEVAEVLSWDNISVEQRLTLLKKKQEKFSLLDYEYPEEIALEIFRNHKQETDSPQLYKEYHRHSTNLKLEIYEQAVKRIPNLASATSEGISKELLLKLLEDNSILLQNRLLLMEKYIGQADEKERDKILDAIGGSQISHALQKRTRKSVPKTEPHALILSSFKKVGVIVGYDEIGDTYKIKLLKDEVLD